MGLLLLKGVKKMNDISKEFVKVMHENYFHLTKENLNKHLRDFAWANRSIFDLDEMIMSDDKSFDNNLAELKEDRELIVSELKDYFED